MRDPGPLHRLLPVAREWAAAVGHGRPPALGSGAPARGAGEQASIPHQLVASRWRRPRWARLGCRLWA
eukprot:6654773-Lingulodinium_polyedra.AAC.1